MPETFEEQCFRVDCAWTMLIEARFTAEGLARFGEWKSVDELPDDAIQGYCRLFAEGSFQATNDAGEPVLEKTVSFGYYDWQYGQWTSLEGDLIFDVVRWMLIPEPSPEIIESTKKRRAEIDARMAARRQQVIEQVESGEIG